MKLVFWVCVSHILPLVSCLPGLAKGNGSSTTVNQTTCNDRTYTYDGLAGYGFVPSDFRDKTGDTFGGPSSAAFESWKKTREGSYEGIIWLLPDRGW